MIALSGPELAPAGGAKAKQAVVLLHGYGSNGADLLGLAPHWAALLPQAAFLAPDAPFPWEMNPLSGGRQWFGLSDLNPMMMLSGLRTAAQILDSYLDRRLAALGLDDAALALVGFSQGAMMALHVGLRRPRPPAAVIAYSGQLLAPELLAGEARARPPVLLVHGALDPVVPVAALAAAERALGAAGLEVSSLERPHLDHAIDAEGLEAGGRFLAAAFKA